MYEFCDANAIAYERCGKLIVAVREDELPRLAELEARGRANGVPGLRRVEAGEIADIEPECRGLAALHSPGTGIVDFAAVAKAMERELRGLGAEFALGRTITAVRREHGQTVLAHAGGITGPPGRSCAPGYGRTGWRCRPELRPIRVSFPSAGPICAWRPTGRPWSAGWSTRCPTRSCRFSGST